MAPSLWPPCSDEDATGSIGPSEGSSSDSELDELDELEPLELDEPDELDPLELGAAGARALPLPRAPRPPRPRPLRPAGCPPSARRRRGFLSGGPTSGVKQLMYSFQGSTMATRLGRPTKCQKLMVMLGPASKDFIISHMERQNFVGSSTRRGDTPKRSSQSLEGSLSNSTTVGEKGF